MQANSDPLQIERTVLYVCVAPRFEARSTSRLATSIKQRSALSRHESRYLGVAISIPSRFFRIAGSRSPTGEQSELAAR